MITAIVVAASVAALSNSAQGSAVSTSGTAVTTSLTLLKVRFPVRHSLSVDVFENGKPVKDAEFWADRSAAHIRDST